MEEPYFKAEDNALVATNFPPDTKITLLIPTEDCVWCEVNGEVKAIPIITT